VQKLADYHLRSRVFSQDFAERLPRLPQLTMPEQCSSKAQEYQNSIKRGIFRGE
jgi:hypothetical protein